jgi:hypothetical protein
MSFPSSRDQFLRREEAAAALRALGIPISGATLTFKAMRGNGPPYRRFGRDALYRWGDLLDWALDGHPVRTSSRGLPHVS